MLSDSFARYDTSTPVVVLGARYGGLAVARSLGRAGVPVYAIGAMPGAGLRSRYWTRTFIWDLVGRSPGDTVTFLHQVAKTIGRRAILIATTDIGATVVAGASAELQESFNFPKVDPDRLRMLINKEEMSALATQLGVPTAQVSVPRSRDDVAAFANQAAYPVVGKGIDPSRPQGKMKMIANRPEELLAAYADAGTVSPPNFMLQEYIPGDDETGWTFYGYFDESSDCLASFSARKIRLAPAYTGVISLGVSDDNQTVQEGCRRFMKAAGYRGPVNIGGKFDRRDGQYKVLDVNARLGASFRHCLSETGLDIVQVMYLHLTGQRVPAQQGLIGRKWLFEEDLFAFRQYVRDGRLTYGQWWRSLRGVHECAWWAPDDPMPFVWWGMGQIRNSLRWRRGGPSGDSTG